MSSHSLTPVSAHLISIGKALSRSVYSAAGERLLSQGFVIESTEQLEALLNSGYFRKNGSDGTLRPTDNGPQAAKSAYQPTQTEVSPKAFIRRTRICTSPIPRN